MSDFSEMKEKFESHYKTIGANVKRLRKEQKLTQLELANKCSVNREQISRIENARRDYMHSTLLEVCDALGVSITEIMREKK
jgi:transcriptional regulator with XRE-family HTH domain